MNPEEKVFQIDGLRLLILSYSMRHPDEPKQYTNYEKFKMYINEKKEILVTYISGKIFRCLMYCGFVHASIPYIR